MLIEENDKNNDESEEIIDMKSLTNIELSNALFMNNYLNKIFPKELNDISIISYIEKGSESFVFKAKFNKTNKIIALKIIEKINKENINLNELFISKKLKYKYIINIYGYYANKNLKHDFILMECAPHNLKNFCKKILKKSLLSESFLCYITYQILLGLNHLHSKKIAHFDIKSQNLLINEFLDIKIIDFSIAMDYSKMCNNGDININYRGTKFYIAPEIMIIMILYIIK